MELVCKKLQKLSFIFLRLNWLQALKSVGCCILVKLSRLLGKKRDLEQINRNKDSQSDCINHT